MRSDKEIVEERSDIKRQCSWIGGSYEFVSGKNIIIFFFYQSDVKTD